MTENYLLKKKKKKSVWKLKKNFLRFCKSEAKWRKKKFNGKKWKCGCERWVFRFGSCQCIAREAIKAAISLRLFYLWKVFFLLHSNPLPTSDGAARETLDDPKLRRREWAQKKIIKKDVSLFETLSRSAAHCWLLLRRLLHLNSNFISRLSRAHIDRPQVNHP